MQKSIQLVSHPRPVSVCCSRQPSFLRAPSVLELIGRRAAWTSTSKLDGSSVGIGGLPFLPISFRRITGCGKKIAFWVSIMLRAYIQLILLYQHIHCMQTSSSDSFWHWQHSDEQTKALSSRSFCVPFNLS